MSPWYVALKPTQPYVLARVGLIDAAERAGNTLMASVHDEDVDPQQV